jgi:Outer membrane protein beta-barrel domain
MVRTLVAACFVLLLAVPALAQDEDYPRVQTSMGYANLSLRDFIGDSGHHSGFANSTGFNLTRTWGLENYMGIYSLGNNRGLTNSITLISDFFGGKATYRHYSRFVPYALAGLGIGYFTDSGTGAGQSSFATRFGAGFDVPINDTMSWKVEYSRMRFHIRTSATDSWTSGNNISAGIVFTLAQ